MKKTDISFLRTLLSECEEIAAEALQTVRNKKIDYLLVFQLNALRAGIKKAHTIVRGKKNEIRHN